MRFPVPQRVGSRADQAPAIIDQRKCARFARLGKEIMRGNLSDFIKM